MKSVIVLLGICFFSCNKPYQCESFPPQSIEIKFLNGQGQNILFGPNARFQIDSLRVLKQNNNFNIHSASVRKVIPNSENVIFDFYTPEEKSFIYYNRQTSSDSLRIKWVTKVVKCEKGGTLEYNAIESVSLNSIVMTPVNGVYHFIK